MPSKLKKYSKLFYVFAVLLPVELIAPGYCERRRKLKANKTSERKLSICNKCPIFTGTYCNKLKGGCGCNMPLKLENWPDAPCPKGKF